MLLEGRQVRLNQARIYFETDFTTTLLSAALETYPFQPQKIRRRGLYHPNDLL